MIQFTSAVFAVNFLGGAVVALGPGQAVLALVPHTGHTARYILELIAGVVMLVGAAILWRRRTKLARHELPSPSAEGKSSFLLGLTIAGVELPTAFPYFAAIAAIVGSGLGVASQVIALAVYNIVFVLPLILMVITIMVAGDRAQPILEQGRDLLQRHWPALLAGLALVAGVYVTVLGITGLVSGGHSTVVPHLEAYSAHDCPLGDAPGRPCIAALRLAEYHSQPHLKTRGLAGRPAEIAPCAPDATRR